MDYDSLAKCFLLPLEHEDMAFWGLHSPSEAARAVKF